MTYSVDIPGCPVLLNDILRTPSRHQSRVKANGRKGKMGYVHLEPFLDRLPRFESPVRITLVIYQTKRNPIDIDSVNKTLLDAMKRHGTIVDDNHTGVSSMTVRYAKGFHEAKRVRLTIKG